jgi:heavy metal sensor kinase
MKLPFKSIRWRLQLWHGAILVLVLAAFGCTAYRLTLENRFHLIDQELQHHAEQLLDALAPSRPNPVVQEAIYNALAGRSSNSLIATSMLNGTDANTNLAESDKLLNPRLALEKASLPDNGEVYFAFWETDGTLIRRSHSGPAEIPPPAISSSGFSIRMRGDLRELVLVNKMGLRCIVGRSIAGDLADLHRQAWLMAFVGSGVAVLGLAGGWWMATRAIKPIAEISSTAQKITSGNLTERISVSDTDSELGQLATVLNTTFDRLRSAFYQLKWAFERQTEFTADASHELRTPVSVIIAEAESALARERTPEEYREGMESCLRAAYRMQQLTESLLMLARLDSGGYGAKREQCDFEHVTRETVDLLRPLAEEHGVNLHAELPPTLVVGDGEQLGQVMSNLISNAIYYNRPGGGVRVNLTVKSETIVLTVSDDGQGIAAEDLPHVFERFYRADKARSRANGHVGLGLAIAKAIVESHRGTIHVSSVVGKGSTFTVCLPRQF